MSWTHKRDMGGEGVVPMDAIPREVRGQLKANLKHYLSYTRDQNTSSTGSSSSPPDLLAERAMSTKCQYCRDQGDQLMQTHSLPRNSTLRAQLRKCGRQHNLGQWLLCCHPWSRLLQKGFFTFEECLDSIKSQLNLAAVHAHLWLNKWSCNFYKGEQNYASLLLQKPAVFTSYS